MSNLPGRRVTYEEYLALDAASDEKLEYERGEVFVLGRGTLEHSRLQATIGYALSNATDRRPCTVYSSSARIRAVKTDRACYPDVTVVCGPAKTLPGDPHTITNPTILVEVLSESTEANDRGAKWAHYRRIDSLQEYVLVNQTEPRIEVYRREGQFWLFAEYGPGTHVDLRSIEGRISVDEIYRTR